MSKQTVAHMSLWKVAVGKDVPDTLIPAGYCQCGCGVKTELAKRTNTKRETVRGEPMKFIGHHKSRGWPKSLEHRYKISLARYPARLTSDEWRACKDCGEKKGLSEFGRLKRGLQGIRWQCRSCERISRRPGSAALHTKHRATVLLLLGDCCSRCGITDKRVLAIDHVHGGGNRDRRMRTGAQYQRELIREILAGSTDYRLLCHNCNWLAYLEREK
jgi:hypothetical protein